MPQTSDDRTGPGWWLHDADLRDLPIPEGLRVRTDDFDARPVPEVPR